MSIPADFVEFIVRFVLVILFDTRGDSAPASSLTMESDDEYCATDKISRFPDISCLNHYTDPWYKNDVQKRSMLSVFRFCDNNLLLIDSNS